MTPQAMRAGAALPEPPLTALITMEVPALLKTEFSSLPKVTLGATALACAVPSAATIKAKSGMSPAGMLMPSCECPPPK